ncbi:discoidin domain-containing protein [Carnobacteriaceae bacterium zg-C25]|nr:discoidin domain-containing protein [Carnobacteriaceae bacterium zg-C25]
MKKYSSRRDKFKHMSVCSLVLSLSLTANASFVHATSNSTTAGNANTILTNVNLRSAENFTRNANHLGEITSVSVNPDNPNIFNVVYSTGQKGQVSFYGNNVVRYHVVQGSDTFLETPAPSREDRPAKILDKTLQDYPASQATLSDGGEVYRLSNDTVNVELNKSKGTLKITDKRNNKVVVEEAEPLELKSDSTKQVLKAGQNAHYYGGGTQNGRFAHKGEKIRIVNENNWVDQGVASPNPFYWTTDGYGVLRHTFRPGYYDFENTDSSKVITTHQENRFDAFYFVSPTPVDILRDYYKLTGHPVVLPIFSLYEGHFNAYNRDTWVEADANTPGAVYFDEVQKWYKEYQPSQLGDRQGLKETLNGSPGDPNYPFTARAVVDRYERNDMPLGYMLVNDGYGAGYGQTGTLAGNIENLRQFGEYALTKGVKTGLWTQCDLTPDLSAPPLLQRDLPNEVEHGLVRVLKTDVAWVGPGYSFGLNGITDAARVISEKGNDARPFIVTLDGWGGTQRYAGVWTGDQTGGNWEYIRFHIPTYIGTGLAGNPNVTSDMDGIFGGQNKVVNTRDYQWKTFTTMELNMDGWGRNPKTPFALDTTTTDINRSYQKLKSMLIPYSYSVAHEAADGKPIVRAMFLEFPNDAVNWTKNVQYQYMYGPNFLVAPVYENVKGNDNGDDVRNGIYLPSDAEWIDYFTGKIYTGGKVLNNFDAPIWKTPVFVRNGAIIPMTKPNNNYTQIDNAYRQVDFYPHGSTSFDLVEDDGLTQAYLNGKTATTHITSHLDQDVATLTIEKTKNNFDEFKSNKVTQFNVNVSKEPRNVKLLVNDVETSLRKVDTEEEFNNGTNVYFYDATPNINKFSTAGGRYHNTAINKNPVVKVKTAEMDVTNNKLAVKVEGFANENREGGIGNEISTPAPTLSNVPENNTPTTIRLDWTPVEGATTYELEIDGIVNSNIKETNFTNVDLKYLSEHKYRVRAITPQGHTAWSSEVVSRTKDNPLKFAVEGITATTNTPAQGGTPLKNLVDLNVSNQFHSKWGVNALPETLTLDLKYAYDLDKLVYVPRQDGGNGTITAFKLAYSNDGIHWKEYPDTINWAANGTNKEFKFENVSARYLRFNISGAVGSFVSGNEMLVFKKEDGKKRVVGDYTNDGNIDANDITFLTNYAGLRRDIDNDFGGYVELADLNKNDVIDAYDTYYVTSSLEGGRAKEPLRASGKLAFRTDKQKVNANEEVVVTLEGKNLANVEAINASIPIDTDKYEVVDRTVNVNSELSRMTNFSNVRNHGNGKQEAFVMLSNKKQDPSISGNIEIATIRLRAKQATDVNLAFENTFVVGSDYTVVDSNAANSNEEGTIVPKERITVSGKDGIWQNNEGPDKLNDGDERTLTELKWDVSSNYVDGKLPPEVTLPQDITFTFSEDEPTYLKGIDVVKRPNSNGTVTKYKVIAYNGKDVVYESDEIKSALSESVSHHDFDKVRLVDKVVLRVLEASTTQGVNNRMMTLKEVKFYEDKDALVANKVANEEITVSGKDGIWQANEGLDKLNDGNENTLTELKWDVPGNRVDGQLPPEVTLPQKITFNTTERYLTGVRLVKRPNANGTVTKYKVAVYDGDTLVYESEEIDTPITEPDSYKEFGEGIVKGNKVEITVIQASTTQGVNNKMMTLKEVELYEVDKELLPYNVKNPTSEEDTYNVSYEFVRADGVTVNLPSAITDKLNAKNQTGVANDTSVNTNDISTESYVDTENHGTWTFTGWDKTEATVNGADVVFTGRWNFVADTYTARYAFTKSDSVTQQLPEELLSRLNGKDRSDLASGTQVNTVGIDTQDYRDQNNRGTWKFVSWDTTEATVNGSDVVFTGTWDFEKDPEPTPTTPDNNTPATPEQPAVTDNNDTPSTPNNDETPSLPNNTVDTITSTSGTTGNNVEMPTRPDDMGATLDAVYMKEGVNVTFNADKTEATFEDNNKDTPVSVRIPVSGLEEDVVAFVVEKVNGTVPTLREAHDIYDMYFVDKANNKKQIKSPAYVTVPVTRVVDKVYYVKDDNSGVEEVPFTTTQDGKAITFKVDHFSRYAIVFKNGDTPKATQQDLPSTGEQTSHVALMGIGLVLLGITITIKKKEQ